MGIIVHFTELAARVVIQFQMVMRINQAGENRVAFQVNLQRIVRQLLNHYIRRIQVAYFRLVSIPHARVLDMQGSNHPLIIERRLREGQTV